MIINDQSDILPGDYVVIEEDGHPIAGVTWDKDGNLMLGARVIRRKEGFALRPGLVFLTATRNTSTRPTPDEVREQARNAHDPDPDFEVLPEVEDEDETEAEEESPWVTVSISGDPEIVREMLGLGARTTPRERVSRDAVREAGMRRLLRSLTVQGGFRSAGSSDTHLGGSDLDSLNTRREGL